MFNSRLESLRGLAALMVAIGHSFIAVSIGYMDGAYAVHYSELQSLQDVLTRAFFVFFNGGAAVSVFFVLSGYVLGLSLNKKTRDVAHYSLPDALGFVTRRLFRLFPAHVFGLTLVILSLYAFHEYWRFPNASPWFLSFYSKDMNLDNIVDNYLLLDSNLNPITWTLQIELLMSLLFPLAFIVCRGLSLKGNIVALVVLYYFCRQLHNFYLLYSFVFYAGLILSQLDREQMKKLPTVITNLVFVFGLVVLLSARLVIDAKATLDIAVMECVGAVMIVFVLSNGLEQRTVGKFLDYGWVRELGRISYSFYVLHFIVMYWVAYLAFLNLSPVLVNENRVLFGLGVALVSIPLAVVIAKLSYRWVEKPFIGWGASSSRWVSEASAKLSPKVHVSAISAKEYGLAALVRRFPGIQYLLAIVPLLLLAQATFLFGRSGVFVPMKLAQHEFGWSDLLNFQILALAYPLLILIAVMHYLSGPLKVVRMLRLALIYSALAVLMTTLHFGLLHGAKGMQIFSMQDPLKFLLAWLSTFGSHYYLLWSMALAVILAQLLWRLPSMLLIALLVFILIGLEAFVGTIASSEYLFSISPWSPLNALPISAIAVIVYRFRSEIEARSVILAGGLLAFGIALAFYEWSFMLSEHFAKSQLAALPIHTRLSVICCASACLIFALSEKRAPGAFVKMLASNAVPVCLLYPVIQAGAPAIAKLFAVNQVTYANWMFVILALGLYLLAHYVRVISRWRSGARGQQEPFAEQA